MDEVVSVAYSPDGRHALSGDREGSVRLWVIETGREIRRFVGHTGGVDSVTFSPIDGRYALTAGIDQIIRLWEVATGREIRRLVGHGGGGASTSRAISVTFSPNGLLAASGSEDKTARVWELKTGREILRLEGHMKELVGVAISPEGKHVLTASLDATIRVWDLQNGREIYRIRFEPGAENLVTGVAYSPDGRSALSTDLAAGIYLWDLEGEREIRHFKGHTGNVFSGVFSPDGHRVLSGSGSAYFDPDLISALGTDNTVRLWNLQDGGELARFEGHTGNVFSVAFSPDGLLALSGSGDKTVRLWALPH
jgi:WD40 repeat protein